MISTKAGWAGVIVLGVLLAALGAGPSHAQAGLVRRGAKELLELVTRKAGREGAERLVREFGEEGLEELLERAAKEGGEAAQERVFRLVADHGVDAVRVLRKTPVQVAKVLDDLPAEDVGRALGALARSGGDDLGELAVRHGAGVLEAELRHPGLATSIVRPLGDDGLEVAGRLTTDQAIVLARKADDIAQLPPAARQELMQRMRKDPAGIIGALQENPRVLDACTKLGIAGMAVGGATAVGVKAAEGTETEYDENGNVVRETRGVMADAAEGVGEGLKTGFSWGIPLMLVAAVVLGFGFVVRRFGSKTKGKGRKGGRP